MIPKSEHSLLGIVLSRGETSRHQLGLAANALRNPTASNKRTTVAIGEITRGAPV